MPADRCHRPESPPRIHKKNIARRPLAGELAHDLRTAGGTHGGPDRFQYLASINLEPARALELAIVCLATALRNQSGNTVVKENRSVRSVSPIYRASRALLPLRWAIQANPTTSTATANRSRGKKKTKKKGSKAVPGVAGGIGTPGGRRLRNHLRLRAGKRDHEPHRIQATTISQEYVEPGRVDLLDRTRRVARRFGDDRNSRGPRLPDRLG